MDVQVVAPSRSCGGRKTSCGAEAAAVEWLDPLPAGSALRRADSNRSLASIYFDAVSQADSVESFLTAFCNTPTSVASSFTDTFFDAGGFDGSQPRTPGTSAGGASACSASAGGAHSYAHGPGHGHAHVEHASARAAAVEAAAAAGASPAELVLRQYKQVGPAAGAGAAGGAAAAPRRARALLLLPRTARARRAHAPARPSAGGLRQAQQAGDGSRCPGPLATGPMSPSLTPHPRLPPRAPTRATSSCARRWASWCPTGRPAGWGSTSWRSSCCRQRPRSAT